MKWDLISQTEGADARAESPGSVSGFSSVFFSLTKLHGPVVAAKDSRIAVFRV